MGNRAPGLVCLMPIWQRLGTLPYEIGAFLGSCRGENIPLENLFITIGLKNADLEIQKLHELESKYKWTNPRNICIDAPNFYIPNALDVLASSISFNNVLLHLSHSHGRLVSTAVIETE